MNALEVLAETIRGTKFEGDVFEVGGSVRDRLLGLPSPEDIDLVTEQSADELATLLFERGVTRDPPVTFENFGTAMVHIQGVPIEIVRARRESYRSASRKPDVRGATYLEDAERRDFTVNTILMSVQGGGIIDLLGTGVDDLSQATLRTPLDPLITFDEDPLRMLRAVRLAAKLSFSYAEGISDAIATKSSRLDIVSIERVRDEFVEMVCGPEPARAMEDLRRFDLLRRFLPELHSLKGLEQGDYHHLDAWDHTLLTIRNLESASLELRLAALFHDIGKTQTKIVKGGKVRFFGHEHLGESLTRTIMSRLRFSKDLTERVCRLVKNHMRLGSAPNFTPSAARKLLKDLGADVGGLLALVQADASSLAPGVKEFDVSQIRVELNKVAEDVPLQTFASPLSGREIMLLTGLPPGHTIGEIKAWLLEKVLEGELGMNDKEMATSLVLHKIQSRKKN